MKIALNLQEYVEIAKKEIDDFKKEWEESSKKDPSNYPETMCIEDWEDQAQAFKSLQEDF